MKNIISKVIQNKNGMITLGYLLLINSLMGSLLFKSKTPLNIKNKGTPIRPSEL